MLIPSGTCPPKPKGRWILNQEYINGIQAKNGVWGDWEHVTKYWWVLKNEGYIYACGPEIGPVIKRLRNYKEKDSNADCTR